MNSASTAAVVSSAFAMQPQKSLGTCKPTPRKWFDRSRTKRLKDAERLGSAGKPDEAVRIVRDLVRETPDGFERFFLLYYEMCWLLDMGAVVEARSKLNEMQTQMSHIDGLGSQMPVDPQDNDQEDLAAGSAVVFRFAETKLLIKEKNEPLALAALEDLMSRYPRQLSQRIFDELRREAEMHAGMLLANADRWLEAGVFLERTVPSKQYKPIWSYYLGQYYCTVRNYRRAAKLLKESITSNMPPEWQSRARYMLGLSEYHLAHVKEAKRNFEFCVQTADTEYIRKNNIWGWLEKTSRDLGLIDEAERHRKMREEIEDISPN
jgi:tetratricopeptide (TPR) repeat protein